MFKPFLLLVILSAFLTINANAQSESSKKQAPDPVNKEEKSGKIFEAPAPLPDVKANEEKEFKLEEELIEESPAGGEPVIGAEVFEEQNPAQPVENKKAEPEPKKEKGNKPDEIITD